MDYRKIKYLLGILAVVTIGCSDEVYDTLSGTPEKTPLMVSTNLNLSGSVQTRAVNKEFAAGDEFMVCIRHVIDNGSTITEVGRGSSSDPVDEFHPRAYATFKVTSVGEKDSYKCDTDFSLKSLEYGNTTQSNEGLTLPQVALYWDDFSSSSLDETDLRTENHKLQSYYGYCFNGASNGTGEGEYSLTKETGVLTWKIQTNQSKEEPTKENFKKSDLLWSVSQNPVQYGHKSSVNDQSRDGLTIPFTHAMSKVSVKVTVDTDAGFVASADLFNNVDVILKSFRTSCTLTPTTSVQNGSIDYASSTRSDITMRKEKTSNISGNYEAIVVPSELTKDAPFATIVVDGNKYNIPVTEGMLQVASDQNSQKGWGGKLTQSSGNYQMWQGVNYVLEVTLKKTKIGVTAKIMNWDEVIALGKGDVDFTDDVTDIVFTPAADEPDAITSFDLWRSVYDKENPTSRNYDENNDESDGVTKATTTTISGTGSGITYTNDPEIYWPNGSTSYYFRALSKYDAETNKFVTVGNIFDVVQGTDMLWATTAKHDGKKGDAVVKHYNEGDPIDPRTGSVPMIFKHAMSKITINLQNKYSESDVPAGVDATNFSDPRNPLLNLADAKIQISNMKLSGTIALEDGAITPTGDASNMFTGNIYAANDDDAKIPQVENYVVIPQGIPNEARVIITLADGTTYSLQLNTCVDSNSTAEPKAPITTWQRGNHYTYTITLSKETITFRALIKDWVETTGGGNATLDWD